MPYTAAEIAELQARLALYYAAEAKVLSNQAATLPDGRSVTRADLKEIRQGIADLRLEIETASGTPIVKGRARLGVNMNV